VNAYEKTLARFSGGTPPPRSRIRIVMAPGTTPMVMTTSGKSLFIMCAWGRSSNRNTSGSSSAPSSSSRFGTLCSTVARKAFLSSSVMMYSRCEPTDPTVVEGSAPSIRYPGATP
jgi:hypothetical protein